MQEIEIARYSQNAEGEQAQAQAQEPNKMLEEWKLLSAGFLNYEKVMFCFAIDELEYHINFYSKVRRPPPATVAQLLKMSKQEKANQQAHTAK
jgi:hypothetical protein